MVFKLALLEFKKIFKNKGIYIGILIAALFSIAIGMQARVAPQSFSSKHVFSFFASIANLIIIIYASKSLGDEFQLKTSTQLFTSRQSRGRILAGKILSLILLAIILGIISGIILIIFKVLLNEQATPLSIINDIFTQIYTYVIYAFVIGSFSLCVTTLNFNTTSTMVTTLGAFWIAPNIFALVIDRFPKTEGFLKILPFCSADALTTYHSFTSLTLAVLLIFGAAVFIINVKMINKIDLR